MRLQKHERDILSSTEVKLSQLSIIPQKNQLQWGTYNIREEFKAEMLKLRIF